MNKEEFIGKLQMCYFGDRNAFDEIVSVYDKLKDRIDKAIEYMEKHEKEGTLWLVKSTDELKEILKGDKE